MKKIVMGSMLATGFLFAGHAQAHTEDARLDGLLGVTIGTSISSHRHVTHHYDQRPARHVYHAPRYHAHPHPQGKAHGYWRKHNKHHCKHGKHNYGRHWDRYDRHHGWHRGD